LLPEPQHRQGPIVSRLKNLTVLRAAWLDVRASDIVSLWERHGVAEDWAPGLSESTWRTRAERAFEAAVRAGTERISPQSSRSIYGLPFAVIATTARENVEAALVLADALEEAGYAAAGRALSKYLAYVKKHRMETSLSRALLPKKPSFIGLVRLVDQAIANAEAKGMQS
jgi:hypothetical protein